MRAPLSRPLLLILLPLLAIPLTPPIAYFLGPTTPLQPFEYLIAWFYSTCLITLIGGLVLPSRVIDTLIPTNPLPRLPILSRVILGQTAAAWLLALVAIALLALALTTRVGPFAAQQAVWMKLALDLEPDAAPPILLHYGPGKADTLAIKWQPYQESDLAVRALNGSPAPIIQKIATDRGEVKLRETAIRHGLLTKQGIIANGPRGALISWPRQARAIDLTLAPGAGTTEILWYDQRVRVQLSQQPTRVLLRLPTQYQGWAMLPAQTIEQLSLELPPGDRTYRFRSVQVLSNRPQAWLAQGPRWSAQGCVLNQQDSTISIQTRADSACLISLPDVRPLNPIHTATVIGIWALIAGVLLIGLALLTTLLRRIQHYHAEHPLRFGPQAVHSALAPRWIMLVWGIALTWHLIYALTVPIGYTNDSYNYYEVGQSLPNMSRMADYWSERTPGYPLVIALINGVFGETALWLIIIQQLALSLLAPLAMWVLATRIAPIIVMLTGLAIGFSPTLTLGANFIHTEAIYTLCMLAALLLYARLGARPRVLLICGVLIGIGTMQRPAGAIVLVILAAWLLMLGWGAPARSGSLRRALIGSVALSIGYIVFAGPWHIYLALARHTFDPSDGRAAITLWANVVKQHQFEPGLAASWPDRAIWELPDTWANDPFELTAQHPQLITNVIDLRQVNYLNETFREATNTFPSRLRESQQAAFLYNLAFWKSDQTTTFYWEDFNYFLNQWEQIDQTPPPALTSNNLGERMPLLTYRWFPKDSLMREACFALTNAAFNNWGWVALLALFSPVTLLISNRRLFPCWLYWIALVLANSAIGIPAQRYIIVCEPVIYLLAFLNLHLLWSFGQHLFRSTTSTALHKQPQQ